MAEQSGVLPKDHDRIQAIVKKSKGDKDQIIKHSKTMANAIKDRGKAEARAIAADMLARKTLADLEFDTFHGLVESAKVFRDKAIALGIKGSTYKFLWEEESNDSEDSASVNDMII